MCAHVHSHVPTPLVLCAAPSRRTQDNATFLRGEQILNDIFNIEWSFGVGLAKQGELGRVAENLKRVLGRSERIRLLTGTSGHTFTFIIRQRDRPTVVLLLLLLRRRRRQRGVAGRQAGGLLLFVARGYGNDLDDCWRFSCCADHFCYFWFCAQPPSVVVVPRARTRTRTQASRWTSCATQRGVRTRRSRCALRNWRATRWT
jgi:hypothetical protein